MHLCCPDCQHSFETEESAVVVTVVKCKSCNNIFEYTDQLREAGLPIPFEPNPEFILFPPGIMMNTSEEVLKIKFTWKEVNSDYVLFFGVIWNLILYFMAIYLMMNGPIELFLGLTPFYAIGFMLVHRMLCHLTNTTLIKVTKEKVRITNRPFHFFQYKDQQVSKIDLDQVFVRREEEGEVGGNLKYIWNVYIKMKKGKNIPLVKNLKTEVYALFIEQEIEKYLGIVNKPIAGEWKG